jgi:hypothetical protein
MGVEAAARKEEQAQGGLKLEDFGEKLGGARKDKQPSLDKELSDDDIRTQPLSKIWPKSEVDAIEDTFLAAVATAARAEIPNKPQKGYKLDRWVKQVNAVRSLAKLVQATTSRETFMEKAAEFKLEGFTAKVRLLEQLDRETWGRIGKVVEYKDAYRWNEDGTKVPRPWVNVQIDGSTQQFQTDNVLNVVDKVQEKLGIEVAKKKMEFEVRGRKGKWAINKKGDPLYRPLKTFDTETSKDALDYRSVNYDNLVQAWEGVKDKENVKERDLRRDENRPRTGADHRKGKDVTPDMILKDLGFRGIEFGNWVGQGKNDKERQGMLNAFYDASFDLARILNIPPKAISLNGTLGIGFGSRGSGWASAHYEPTNLVINMTKTRGAGSLAHELFHAIDRYFQMQRDPGWSSNREGNYITYAPETYYQDGKTGHRFAETDFKRKVEKKVIRNPENWTRIEGVRPEVAEAFDALVKALDASPMAKRASLIDKGKSGGYWSRVIERAARAFENYVIYKMQQQGYNNDYLANIVDAKDFQRDVGRYPYLLSEEIAPVAEAFDNLFATIQTKETDKGVALYDITSVVPLAIKELTRLGKAGKDALPHLVTIGRGVYSQGATTYQQFARGMKGKLGKLWDTFKGQMLAVWRGVKAKLAEERGSFSTKAVSSDKAVYDWADRDNSTRDRIVSEYLSGKHAQMPWKVVPAGRLAKIWRDTTKSGVVRDEKGLNEILDQLIENAQRLQFNNEVSGHEQFYPDSELESINEDYPGMSGEDQSKLREKISDWTNTPEGDWRISDYGLPKIQDYLLQALDAKTPEAKLVAIDKALNVVHQRSDLASWFVEGGAKTLSGISGEGMAGDILRSNPMFDPAIVVKELKGLAGNIKAAMPKLQELGKQAYSEGATTYKDFAAKMRDFLGDSWNSFKSAMLKVYQDVKRMLKDERGLFGPDINAGRGQRGQFSDLTDRKAKVEIDDSGAKWKTKKEFTDSLPISEQMQYFGGSKEYKLGDLLDHPELYKAFPEAKNIPVQFLQMGHDPKLSGTIGGYDPVKNKITLNGDMFVGNGGREIEPKYVKEMKITILHEIQHFLQERGGFAGGGNPDTMPAGGLKRLHDISPELSWAYGEFNPLYRRLNKDATPEQRAAGESLAREYGRVGIEQSVENTLKGEQQIGQRRSYKRLAGEEEARRASARANMTSSERTGTPYDRTDIADPKDLIVSKSTGTAMSVTESQAAKAVKAARNVKEAVAALTIHPKIQEIAHSIIAPSGRKVSGWGRSVGTMYHLAETLEKKGMPQFKQVYLKGQQFLTDIATLAIQAETLAPRIFPKMGLGGSFKHISKIDRDAISSALIDGTLEGEGDPTLGRVWTDAELVKYYKFTPTQVGLYHEARAATDQSLDDFSKGFIAKYAKEAGVAFDRELSVKEMAADVVTQMRALTDDAKAALKQNPDMGEAFAKKQEAFIGLMDARVKAINDISSKAELLKAKGYFPLMRFGEYKVMMADDKGKVQYFGLFESKGAAFRQAQKQRAAYPNMTVTQGVMGKEQFKLYAGLNLEAMSLFAEHLDASESAAYQEYLKVGLNNRSVMKRMIKRQGTAGYSEDGVRILANFITSNARHASTQYHLNDMAKLVDKIPAVEQGDVQDQGVRLYEYIKTPLEEASALRGYLFVHYIGGSVASALTNLTQPIMMTAPQLATKTSVANVVKHLTKAAKLAFIDPAKIGGQLGKVLRQAEATGITAPQEIHQLTAMASNRLFASNTTANTLIQAWGRMFSMAEAFNRITNFIAAYNIALETNSKTPYEDAIQSVHATQGVYNRGNRPPIARGAIGATLMTFKQFTIMYLELFSRLPMKQKLMMAGIMILASGVEGLPFAGDAEDLIDTIMQWLGYQGNSKVALRKATTGLLGDDLGEFVLTGASKALPIDLHGRLGMANLVPGTGILKQSSTDKTRDIQEFFGPAGSLLASVGDALTLTATGQPGRGAIALLPRAAQGFAAGAEMAATGEGHDKRGGVTAPVTMSESLAKFIGLNPSRIAQESRVKSEQMQDLNILRVRKAEIMNLWVNGILSKNRDEIMEAKEKLQDWNRKNPELRIRINPTSINQKVQASRLTSKQRFIKSIPKEQKERMIDELG